ncbi:hypothetical protein [Chryseosolibacter indicus]|uniref:YokE-like PH domain-containing protein n=1 Tax=Chryseosolibacter indicus TaxID=2782351 RepID=A0ABS5VVH5_9BACT|nr:hypothetical protein [Chryseosolibacter indicus]MBT1705437.1 hypothetical protein [Chryseosolibacter indicus]
MKPDKSIRDICIAAIKRSTIPPFDFPYTFIYEEGDEIENIQVSNSVILQDNESLICSTIIDEKIWTVLTTRRIFSFEGVGLKEHSLLNINKWDFGDFKDYSKQTFTKGFLSFEDGNIVPVFVETGRASMVMIYGIMTFNKQVR